MDVKQSKERIKELRANLDEQRTVIVDAKREARGAGLVKRKKSARTMVEAQAELGLLQGELDELTTALPAMVEAEAKGDAQRRVADINKKVPALLDKLRAAEALQVETSNKHSAAITDRAAVRLRVVVGQREIRLLSLRHNLPLPPMVDDPEMLDTMEGPLTAARTAPVGPKPFRPHHTASDDPATRRRTVMRQMRKYVQNHRGALSRDTLAIFARCGYPDAAETESERDFRVIREKRKREQDEDFNAQVGGPMATAAAGERHAMGPDKTTEPQGLGR